MIIRLILMALGASIAFAAGAANAAVYTVAASRDSMIKEAATSENNGSLPDPLVKTNSSGMDRHRILYGFTLPVIPANETITSAVVRFRVVQSSNRVVNIHRVTDIWVENTVTWANTGTDFNATSETSFTPSTANVYVTATVTNLVRGWRNGTFANHGLMLLGTSDADAKLTSREWPTATERPELVITTVLVPPLTVVKSSQAYFDPLNGTTNPKMIPGGFVAYTISVTNPGAFPIDNASVVVDAAPANLQLYVGDVPGGSGPLLFQDGAPASGLSYTYSGLASTTDDIDFSNDGGATWIYVPVPGANLVDANVTHIRIRPRGTMAAGSTFYLLFEYLIQ